ncbi:MAG TPA: peroxidase [Actinobacteria bacterium]|nr:peroxidase [Actinomycetota bacterium]
MNDPSPAPTRRSVTRRGVLAAGGAAFLGAAGGFALGRTSTGAPAATDSASTPPPPSPPQPSPSAAKLLRTRTIPFHGAHQAGIETTPALLQTFIGLDLREAGPETALAVLRIVTDDAARLTQGQPALGDTEPELAEVPAGLTITLGLGRPFFLRTGTADRIPEQLTEIPAFSTDRLEDRWGQTDLLLQVGADDAMTLAHATRMLTKDLSTLTETKWVQPGFRSSAPAIPGGSVTRNLLSQPDGIVNPAADTDQFDEVVWIPEGPAWVAGGTVLVLRRIRLLMDTWDILDRETQELVMGRRVADGAPLGAEQQTDVVPFDAVDERGLPLIPDDAHIRVAHAATTREMILRRPYNYENGMREGTSDMGLLFAAYMRDPSTSFIPMQERLAQFDAFNEWNTTIGSAAYFIPAGIEEGQTLAEGIFT